MHVWMLDVDTTQNHVLIDAYRIINSLHLITRFTQSCHWCYNLAQCKYIFIGLHLNAALIIYCIDSFTSSMLNEVICNKNSDDSFQRYSLALQCRFYIQPCNNPNDTKWYSYLYMWHSYFEMHNLLYKTGFLPDWTKKINLVPGTCLIVHLDVQPVSRIAGACAQQGMGCAGGWRGARARECAAEGDDERAGVVGLAVGIRG